MGATSLAVVVCGIFLLGGFALKAQCLAPWQDYNQYRTLCYNDLQPLYAQRGVADRVFPYVNGELTDEGLTPGAIEYPVLTGLFMYAGGFASETSNDYLVHSAILLAPFGLIVAHLLARMGGLRALMWAAAPAIVLYAFHNWDLLVVAATVGGFYMWSRGSPLWAAALFGVGASLKMYPLFFLGPLVLEQLHARRWLEAGKIVGAGVGTLVLINAPFAVANFDGWWATYEFHRIRGPNWDSIWNLWVPTMAPARLNLITMGLTVASFVIALSVGWARSVKEGRYPVLAVSGAMMAAFLLFNKVHSPQYILWILPFFVLVRIHWLWWVGYSIMDIFVYVGVFRFFYDFAMRPGELFAKRLMDFAVWGRAALLVFLFVVFLTARRSVVELSHPDHGRVPSHPGASVTSVEDGAAAGA